jgi:hypothetical protein
MINKILSIFKKKPINKSCLNCKFFLKTHDNQCDLDFFRCWLFPKQDKQAYEHDGIKPEAFEQGFFPDTYFCKHFKLKK